MILLLATLQFITEFQAADSAESTVLILKTRREFLYTHDRLNREDVT